MTSVRCQRIDASSGKGVSNMRRTFLCVPLLLGLHTPLPAQHYLAVGGGFTSTWYKSDDLQLFRNTYNAINAGALVQPLKGFDAGVGLQAEAGYRYLGRFSLALLGGWQQQSSADAARFGIGESRRLKLRTSNIYASTEAGFTNGAWFINGLAIFHFNRQLRIESTYQGEPTNTPNALDGTYRGKAGFAADLGVAFGLMRAPLFLVAKVSYPVYTGGENRLLDDPAPAKIDDNLNFFPDDFIKFVDLQSYKGVASNIDGWKVMITFALIIPLQERDD